MGAKPSADRSLYPSKVELLKAFEECARTIGRSRAESNCRCSGSAIARANAEIDSRPWANLVLGLMTSHFATHLGQLSA